MTRRAATVLPWHGGIGEMVRFTHHDRAFSWLTMMQLAAANSHVILTGGRDLTVWHGGISEMVRCAATKSHVILTGGRDLTVWHGGISEMVRFTHHDRAFSWLTRTHRAAAKSHVILTGGRDLAAMAWRNSVRWFTPFTMTGHFPG
jgi:hypothetical protein